MDAGPGRGWQSLHDILEQHETFLLTSHVFPEGDSIGSEVALAHHLTAKGKRVRVLNPSPARDCYRFLLDLFPIHHLSYPTPSAIPRETEVIIALDVGSWDYMGALGEIIRGISLPLVVLDHHHGTPDFGDLRISDPDAASTGELVYQYLRWAGATITPEIAQALYTSLLFDTGGFRLPHTSNRAVLAAAELLRHGADHRTVAQALFESESYERVDLFRRALGTLRQEQGGRIAWLSIPHRFFTETETTLQDGDGILDCLLSIAEVDICVLFREVTGFGSRVTFRSKGEIDVGVLASQLGGGGRPTAAGVTLPINLREAEGVVLPLIRGLIDLPTPVSFEARRALD